MGFFVLYAQFGTVQNPKGVLLSEVKNYAPILSHYFWYINKAERGEGMLYVVIGGYRNFNDYEAFKVFVDASIAQLNETEFTILSGHCKGVDLMAEQYAMERNYGLEIFSAEWEKYGRAAGPIRNKQMVEKANVVIAFVCERAKGTKNLISQAEKLEKRLFIKNIE